MARPRKVVAESATTAPQATEQKAVQEPVRNVVATQRPKAEQSKAKPYFLGTTDDCPYWNLNLGGFTFHRETAELIAAKRGDDDILAQGPPVRGHVEMLTPESIERIKKHAATKVIRWVSAPRWETDRETGEKTFKGNGRIYSTSPRGPEAPQFVPMDTDEPISKYVYVMDVSTLEPSAILGDRRSLKVKTLYESMEDGTL